MMRTRRSRARMLAVAAVVALATLGIASPASAAGISVGQVLVQELDVINQNTVIVRGAASCAGAPTATLSATLTDLNSIGLAATSTGTIPCTDTVQTFAIQVPRAALNLRGYFPGDAAFVTVGYLDPGSNNLLNVTVATLPLT